jgi:arsenate reductase
MAEGFLRALGGDRFVAESAGTVASALHPLAVRAMGELGIDISAQRSKSIDELAGPFEVCVTVCDANCPIPPNATLQLRWKFPDPVLARGTEDERLAAFRIVRDGLERRVRALVARVDAKSASAHPSWHDICDV